MQLLRVTYDNKFVASPTHRDIENLARVYAVPEPIDRNDNSGAFEASKSCDGGVEDVVTGPQVLPVGAVAIALLLELDGVAVAGGQQGDGLPFGGESRTRRCVSDAAAR